LTTLDYGAIHGGTRAERLLRGPAHFLLRRLHSLTGIVFGGYLVVHLLVNATIAQGGNVYQTQVDKIHDLPFLPVIEWTFIYLPIIYHTVYGVWITLTGQPNVANYPYGKNWAYVAQRVSAVIIVFFMLFHVLALKYGIPEETQEEAVSFLLALERELADPYVLTDEDRAAIERGLDDMRHGRFSSDEEVAAVFRRRG